MIITITIKITYKITKIKINKLISLTHKIKTFSIKIYSTQKKVYLILLIEKDEEREIVIENY